MKSDSINIITTDIIKIQKFKTSYFTFDVTHNCFHYVHMTLGPNKDIAPITDSTKKKHNVKLDLTLCCTIFLYTKKVKGIT